MRGLFCVDPGKATGLAWAIVDDRARLTADAMKARSLRGSTTLTGDPITQARELFRIWSAFKNHCVHKSLLDPSWVELVFEDFVLRPGQHAGGKDGTWPERVAWGFEGYRHGRFDTHRKERHLSQIIWQQPGSAARFKKRPLLTANDAWVVGREHERSAYSHMILRVNTILT